jgi:hypothetical protein
MSKRDHTITLLRAHVESLDAEVARLREEIAQHKAVRHHLVLQLDGSVNEVARLQGLLGRVLKLNYDVRRHDSGVNRASFDAWNDEQAEAWESLRDALAAVEGGK